MQISIVGTGYVGLTAGVGLASKGHEVTCVDIDEDKVKRINQGDCPIYEEGLEDLLQQVLSEDKFQATTNTEQAVNDSEVTFVAVGTPQQEDGAIDLSQIKQAYTELGRILRNKKDYHVFATRSTIVPETTEDVIIPILENNSNKQAGKDFGVCMTPEFLREGVALRDFLDPDRIVIGELDKGAGDKVEQVYEDFSAPILRTSLKTAELIKYASNSLLATKISLINEIGNICKELGIDVYEVADGMGLDHRINREFLNAGCGFGGSCFPKDVRALAKKGEELGQEPKLLEQVINVNQSQKTKLIDHLEEKLGDLEDKTIGVLGLAFKPGTDDTRRAPAVNFIHELKKRGAKVKAYDPRAEERMKEHHPDIHYADHKQEVLENAHAGVILTEWEEFKDLTLEEIDKMENKLLFEGRKVLGDELSHLKEGICWP